MSQKNKKQLKVKNMLRTITEVLRIRMLIVLMIFWIILTGSLDWQQLLTGFLASLFIILFWGNFLIGQRDGFRLSFKNIFLLILFLKDLMIDLVKANIEVAKIVLNPDLPISPGFIKFKLELEETSSQVLLANSITLTPGTLTVLLSHKDIIVHALTKEAAKDVLDWRVQADIKEIEEVSTR
ncbi:Na+/H+ antiporter subunit E [Natronospora cellulosivora (SeqCode)]